MLNLGRLGLFLAITSVLSIGFDAGAPAFSRSDVAFVEAQIDQLLEESLRFDNIGVGSPSGLVPALWGIELVGADIARDYMSDLDFEAHDVVVMDSGVKWGLFEEILKPKREVRRIKRRDWMLSQGQEVLVGIIDGLRSQIDGGGAKGLAKLYSGLFDLDQEIVDPREAILPEPSLHGSHVAGTLGAGRKAFGASPAARIYSLNIFDTPEYTMGEDMMALIADLQSRHWEPTTFNMSFTFTPYRPMIHAYNRLFSHPALISVMAAGNEGQNLHPYSTQAQMRNSIIVGSFSPSGILSGFSNYGTRLDFIAPGEGILSFGDQFVVEGVPVEVNVGTSMAAPLVSASIANIRALHPGLSKVEIYEILKRSSFDLQIPGHNSMTGHGLINTLKATRAAHRLRQDPKLGARHESAYQFEDVAEAKLHQSFREPPYSQAAWTKTREYALLSEDHHSIRMLAVQYASAFPEYARGLEFLIDNRPETSFLSEDESELDRLVETALFALNRAARSYSQTQIDPRFVLRNLSQVDLILEVSEALPDLPLVHAILSQRMYEIGGSSLIEEYFSALQERRAREQEIEEPLSGSLASTH